MQGRELRNARQRHWAIWKEWSSAVGFVKVRYLDGDYSAVYFAEQLTESMGVVVFST